MVSIEPRDLRFPLDDVPRDWHPRGVAVSAYWDQLSVFFPLGEAFFVRSVREAGKDLKDEQLQRDVKAFCAQEGFHGREHLHYNERLAKSGHPIEALDSLMRFVLKIPTKYFSIRRQLAVTCALEHLTSLMGEQVLGQPQLLEGAPPQMAGLWRWHAAEENEHRSVAFDVYQAVGGTFFERSRVMLISSLVFFQMVAIQQVLFMKTRGVLFNVREWARLLGFWWGPTGALRKLVRPYLSYFSPKFHPANRGGYELVDTWKTSLSPRGEGQGEGQYASQT